MISREIERRCCRASIGMALCASLLGWVCLADAVMAQISVPGTANIWGAGHAVPPAPAGGGAGILPSLVTIPAGINRTVVFSSVTGQVRYSGGLAPNGADGVSTTAFPPSPVWGGLAGTDMATCVRYLTGVFIDDTEPFDPAPARMVFLDGVFQELSPGLCQIFYIGDGLTGTGGGTQQTFHIPDTATRLFLGFQDFYVATPNLPGGYGDNSGTIFLAAEFDGTPTGIDGDAMHPSRFVLRQNHPNPFNPRTRIEFTLDRSGPVSLRIYDPSGELVRTLVCPVSYRC
jgi:hypothetical protein